MIMKLKNQRPGPKEAVDPVKKSVRDMKLTTHLHLVPRSRKVALYLHPLICLHGIVLN
jgi:hypothetical protein